MSSTKNSLLCPNCRRLISRDEPFCPYCGLKSPASWLKTRLALTFHDPAQMIKGIIGLNVFMFVLSLLFNPAGIGLGMGLFSLLRPDDTSLFLLGATGTIPLFRFGHWWSLITANYLHGNLLHILFNMMALRQVAPLVASEYGLNRMLVIYTIGGVAGYIISTLAGIGFTIGASAALCSLIGAAIYYGKRRGGAYGQAIYSQLGGWAVTIFIFGFLVPGINNWAHGGGMAAGALLGLAMGFNEQRRESFLHRAMASICIALTLAGLVWAILFALYHLVLSP